jgi:hypothetical protein
MAELPHRVESRTRAILRIKKLLSLISYSCYDHHFLCSGMGRTQQSRQVYRNQDPQIITNQPNKEAKKKLSNGKKTVPGQDDS